MPRTRSPRRPLLLAVAAAVLAAGTVSAGAVSGGTTGASTTAAPVRVEGLRTEHVADPLGIDVVRPRLGWRLVSAARGVTQTAYEVRVASSRSALLAGAADVWQTGRVASDRSVDVEYAGPALRSRERYFWQVQVWDQDGTSSGWSDPASWEMGLLEQSDWSASWVGHPDGGPGVDLEGATWIWYPESSGPDAPSGTRYFRRTVTLPAAPRSARINLTVDDHFTLFVNGAQVGSSPNQTDEWKNSKTFDLSSVLQAGTNVLAVAGTNVGAGGAAFIGRLRAELVDASEVAVDTDKQWLTQNTEQSGWQQLAFDDSRWVAAREVTAYGGSPWGRQVGPGPRGSNALLRRTFAVDKPVAAARLYVTGLGRYTINLNGAPVGDHVLAPDLKDPSVRVAYNTYDVTDQLRPGVNALGAEVGKHTYTDRLMMAQLEVRYVDGSTERVVTDGTWRAALAPTTTDHYLGGETYDARLDQPGYDTGAFDDAAWKPVGIRRAPRGRLTASANTPVRVTETIAPTAVTPLGNGRWLFDFGKLVSGWARLTTSGAAGTTVGLKYWEQYGVQAASASTIATTKNDTYILSGRGKEQWESRFSYTGFRFVEVTGLPGTGDTATLQARMVNSDVDSAGGLETDNQLVDDLHSAMRLTIVDNLQWIPTDTPTFEQRGWMGDAGLVAEASIYNFDMQPMLVEFLNAIRDAQRTSGEIPVYVLPDFDWYQAPEWHAAYPLMAWLVHQHYGDERVLEDHYPALKRYVDWEYSRRGPNGISSSQYSDYLPPVTGAASIMSVTPEGTQMSATAYVYKILTTFADIADAVGRPDDAAAYRAKAETTKTAFNTVFWNATLGAYTSSGTTDFRGFRQTPNALALVFGLVPADRVESVADALARDVVAKGNHLDTGALGTAAILPALSRNGYADLAHAVTNQTSYPSWGHWIAQGATTMWESWEATTRSRAHSFKGTVDEWLFEELGGVTPAAPGYRAVRVRPVLGAGTDRASVEHVSPYGTITSAWERTGSTLSLDVVVPPNSSASVSVPTSDPGSVREGGVPAAQAEGVQSAGAAAGYATFRVGSGRYRFTAALPACPTVVLC